MKSVGIEMVGIQILTFTKENMRKLSLSFQITIQVFGGNLAFAETQSGGMALCCIS